MEKEEEEDVVASRKRRWKYSRRNGRGVKWRRGDVVIRVGRERKMKQRRRRKNRIRRWWHLLPAHGKQLVGCRTVEG